MPQCLVARQRSCALVRVACAYAYIGKEEGIAGYDEKPCFSPESACPRRFETINLSVLCVEGVGVGGEIWDDGDGRGVGGRHID